MEDIGVPEGTLARFGAVSEQTVRAMAEGALAASRAQWAVAVTGVAGPDGGSPEKPVGTVWFAWAGKGATQAVLHRLAGDRAAVRQASVGIALQGLIDRMA
jgi:nicotinamide-nucleotide amidase